MFTGPSSTSETVANVLKNGTTVTVSCTWTPTVDDNCYSKIVGAKGWLSFKKGSLIA